MSKELYFTKGKYHVRWNDKSALAEWCEYLSQLGSYNTEEALRLVKLLSLDDELSLADVQWLTLDIINNRSKK